VTDVNYIRRKTVTVNIGGVPVGSDFPIRVQTMANTATSDPEGSVDQCIRLIAAGAEFVRFTVPSLQDVENFALIRKELRRRGYNTPLIADVHFNAEIALRVSGYADKVRINPGNFAGDASIREKFIPLVLKCRDRGVALRIGVNHGSLSGRIMQQFGDTPAGMAESAMEFLRICKEHHFDQVVVSMKASNVRVMVQATRLIAHKMDREGMSFPLHLGVTEAGEGEDGRIKSAAGIGMLLNEGLGDTIRISLTEEPEFEIPVARKLLQHVAQAAFREPLPQLNNPPTDPFEYRRRISAMRGKTGGGQVPVVVGESVQADFVCEAIPARLFQQSVPHPPGLQFVLFSFADIPLLEAGDIKNDPGAVMIYECSTGNVQAELTWLHGRLQQLNCHLPVILRGHYREDDLESFQIKSAANFAGAFIDGFGDGLWLTNSGPVAPENVISTAYGILQACRSRMSRTEFISCPSCGRTTFNLIETIGRIKKETAHLKGLKIGVMGCIVNGPGEMADADYGYVGAGKGKVTLYKSKQVVKKNIPEGSAVDELIALIKENGDWVEVTKK
jgi:(E)-4-hydroxy-3-methylbut-2-enyl-diphosphate synthase